MGTYSIDFGDGSTFGAPTSNGCTSTTPATCQYQISHTYASAGTYTAILSDSNGVTVSTLSISVLNPNGSTSGLSQVLGNVANFLAGSSSPQGPTQTSSSFPGVFGNILLDHDVVLLTSDGVEDVPDDVIVKLLKQGRSLQEFAEALVALAEPKGDDCTVIAVPAAAAGR